MKKQLKEWGFFVGIFLILFLTGWYKDLAAVVQRGILATGLMAPETELSSDEVLHANYNFNLTDLNGRTVALSEYKGKVIFINFWATWCPPCIAEMPGIQALYNKVASDDIVFLMVSLDDEVAKAKKFIQKKGFTFPVYVPGGPVPKLYNTGTIPTTYVISPEGKVVVRKEGMASYNSKDFLAFLQQMAP